MLRRCCFVPPAHLGARSNQKPKGGDSAPEDTAQAQQVNNAFPVTQAVRAATTANLAEARGAGRAYATLRQARTYQYLEGPRRAKALAGDSE